MVAKLDGGCLVAGLTEGEPAVDGALRIWKHFGREAGAKAISLRVLELPAAEKATLRNEVADEVLYVIAGSGTAGGSAISVDSGIYLPPSASLDIVAGQTLIIVSSQCPDVDGVKVAAGPAAEQPAGRRRNDGTLVVAMRDRPVERTGDRWYREVINADDGSTQVTQFVGGIPPGRSPDHYHLYEEVIVILEGTGVMWAGTSNTPIATGSCIFLPHGQVHCVENRGEGEMQLLGVFYPAGSPAVRYSAK
jgi:mannose-6-phosphate isomerase-like protein (cupin superfamily)